MIVSVRDLTKHFPVRRTWGELVRAPFTRQMVSAVSGVSFDVAEGEIFGLLGQNGAGKTTLFKMLATLLLPDAGSASVAGADVGGDPLSVRRLLAPVLANERSLNWRLTAAENTRLFAALQGLQGEGAARECARVLAVTGLADTGNKLVGAFSSGMRQRLLIARALLGRPRVLLLDEPTRSLDPIVARDLRRFLRETVVRAEGCTLLLATHDADEVWELCDRVGVLDRGRLLAVGATQELRGKVGGDRFRTWVHADDVPRAVALAASLGVALSPHVAAIEAGWEALDCEIRGGAAEVARLVAALAPTVRLARVERLEPSLAELIERVVRAGGADA